MLQVSNKPTPAVVQNNSANSSKPNKKPHTITPQTGIGIGVGAAALAAGGIYIVSKGSCSPEKGLKLIQNASSCMDTIKNIKMSPKNFKQLMFKITSDEKLSEKFINEVISNPRKSKENVRILNRKIGGDKALTDWMLRPGGYQEAYYKYTKKAVSDAKHPDDLIKVSPNWNVWKLKEKFGDDFVFGEPPKEFGGVDGYRNVFNAALNHSHVGFEHAGIKFGDYVLGGLSGKAVRKVEIGDKKYIMKFQPDFGNTDIKDNISMKSDSAFLNSQLERYLDLNGYQQGPKLKFFDYKTNSAIYELSEGHHPEQKMINDILDVNAKLKDLNDLGVYYNDIGTGNFMVNKDNFSFIDSGESSFVDFFKPGVAAYHFSLPNLNGRSITDTAAAINLSRG